MATAVFIKRGALRVVSPKVSNEIVRRTATSSASDDIADLLLKLPRERRSEAVTRRKLIRVIADDERKQKSGKGAVFLQILGNGNYGSPKSLHLYTAKKRYLFNCGEGTQRVANEHKINLARWENIFITRKSWENVGGLLGLALTIQTIGMNELTVHGPPGTENFFRAAQNFIVYRTLKIENVEANEYEDDVIRVQSVPLINSSDEFRNDVSVAYICTVKNYDEVNDSFIVVECPNCLYLDSLHAINKFISSLAVSTIIHFSPSNVVDHYQYQKWMKSFNCRHVIVNDNCPYSRINAACRLQEELNELNGDLFPLLHLSSATRAISSSSNVIYAEPLHAIKFRPEFSHERFSSDDDDVTAKNEKNDLPSAKEEFPYVVFLGTVSGLPSLTRNVSSILLHSSESNCALLDCGEGTYAQLSSFFGATKTAEILRKLSVIFLSHHHADHHLGLIKVLRERYKLAPNGDPVYLLASTPIDNWLDSYDRLVEPIKHLYTFVPNESISTDSPFCPLRDRIEFLPINVVHCTLAHGLVATIGGRWKLVYSGDARPSQALIDAGTKCDLLIHEATMEDTFSTEAKLMKHSTISEAAEVGVKMKARFTILTHFNSRYARFPFMSVKDGQAVGCAFDFMKISPSTLSQITELTPKLKMMFAKEHDEDLIKRKKRQYWKLNRNKEYDY